MTTPHDTARVSGTGPVSCRLTPAGLAAQADRWTGLIAMALTGRTETADGVRLSFRPEPGTAEELRALAAVESECCPWADWTVDASPGAVVLDVRSGPEGLATLHGMFRPKPSQSLHSDVLRGPGPAAHARVSVTRSPCVPASAG
jgi:hypothetical protein